MMDDGTTVLYKLHAAVQHLGSTVSGHFIGLLIGNDETVYVANDRNPLQRLDLQVDQRMCLERATLYLYRKLTPDPEPMDFDELYA